MASTKKKLLLVLCGLLGIISCAESSPIIDSNISQVDTHVAKDTLIRMVIYDSESLRNGMLVVVEQFERPITKLISQLKVNKLPYEEGVLTLSDNQYAFVSLERYAVEDSGITMDIEYIPLKARSIFLECVIPIMPDRLGKLSCRKKQAKPPPQ